MTCYFLIDRFALAGIASVYTPAEKSDWEISQRLIKGPNFILVILLKNRNWGTCCSARKRKNYDSLLFAEVENEKVNHI